MLAADYPFLDILWTMFIFFLFVIWIWILITVFTDVFRRKDIGGGSKTLWIIFVILLPYLGVFVYLIANHDGMADRNIQRMQTTTATDRRLHPVRRRKRRLCGRDREGQGPPRLRCDHAGRVRHAQAEGARRLVSTSLLPGGGCLCRSSPGGASCPLCKIEIRERGSRSR